MRRIAIRRSRLDPMAIGDGDAKINANIGASPGEFGTAEEVEKLNWAQKYGRTR